MDIKIASEILGIADNDFSSLTPDILKKQYHKMALLHHPDKHVGSASHEAKERFQQIQSAYHYLLELVSDDSSVNASANNIDSKEDISFSHILASFIREFAKSSSSSHTFVFNYKFNYDLFVNIIQDIVTGHSLVSNSFSRIDKELAIEIYSFLSKYKHILRINEQVMEQVYQALLKKYERTQLVILNPKLNDMFESNVYKLVYKEETYYVPLWCNEIYYDSYKTFKTFKSCNQDKKDEKDDQYEEEDEELVVSCVPDLPDNVSIDEQNNIHVTITVSLKTIDMRAPDISFTLNNREFHIKKDTLLIKSFQQCTLKCLGIPRIDETDMFNDADKSDIIVHLTIC